MEVRDTLLGGRPDNRVGLQSGGNGRLRPVACIKYDLEKLGITLAGFARSG